MRLRTLAKSVFPSPVTQLARKWYWNWKFKQYLKYGRPFFPGETTKAAPRRRREGFYEKYVQGRGLDIGYGGDPIVPGCQVWDMEHGDAQYIAGTADDSFDFVYTSHTLEHMVDPGVSLKNWFRVVKPGGFLIIYFPHRDLYEKRKTLPSRWNHDHKTFFLLDRDEPPDTVGIIPLIERTLTGYEIIYAKVCDEGHTIHDPEIYSDGEFSLEVVLKKKTE